MAAGQVALADVIVPAIFNPYTQLLTAQKSRLLNSGAVQQSSILDEFLAGGGKTVNLPSWKDLDNDVENVSSDNPSVSSAPNKIGTIAEIAVRMNRNNSWAKMDLTEELIATDPMAAVSNRVAAYWARRMEIMFIAAMTGVFADNTAAPTGTEHVAGDMTYNISGSSYSLGVTTFSAEAFIDATIGPLGSMGDSSGDFGMVMVHSIVFARMKKNNLIDFIPDARGEVNIPTFLGRRVIEDDRMPIVSAGVYETWIFGPNAVWFGSNPPEVPTEVFRNPEKGTGGGMETLYNRVQWAIHPRGFKFIDTSPAGGPANGSGSGDLANAGSWQRVYPERKQIAIARLITREA